MNKITLSFAVLLCVFSCKAFATTTVTVDDNNAVHVNQGSAPVVQVLQPVIAQPVLMAVIDTSKDFEGEIERIDRSTRTIDVIDTEGRTRQVQVAESILENYRTGDFVQIHPMPGVREVTFIREESNRDLEGRIINVNYSQNTIMVHDTRGRERRIKLKQGMINNYKVDDFVRIHLMADLKEAKMIRTIQ